MKQRATHKIKLVSGISYVVSDVTAVTQIYPLYFTTIFNTRGCSFNLSNV